MTAIHYWVDMTSAMAHRKIGALALLLTAGFAAVSLGEIEIVGPTGATNVNFHDMQGKRNMSWGSSMVWFLCGACLAAGPAVVSEEEEIQWC